MNWVGAPVADSGGRRYGRLEQLFISRASRQPEFGVVSLGDDGGEGRVVVPLAGARHHDDGTLVLGVDPERVMSAPRMQRDVDEIPAQAGELILEHFGLSSSTPAPPVFEHEPEWVEEDHVGDDAPTDVIRSEEQLTVGTRAEATERVRIRKRVVTEDVTLTITLRREELVIEREPIAVGEAPAPAEFPLAEEGSEMEFVLHAEEPVVSKRVVPVERVRLHREVATEDQQVTGTLRKERVDVEHVPLTREDPMA